MKRPRKILTRILGEPAVHFVLAGAALFLLSGGGLHTAARAVPGREGLSQDPSSRAKWSPAVAGTGALVGEAMDEELLYREAVARRLDQDDPAVRGRLIQKARFVSARPEAGDDDLHREAIALGLERGDPVIRRILVEKMRLALSRPDSAEPAPSEADLAAWLARHQERFVQPARITLEQVFLSNGRGSSAARDARRSLAWLRAGTVTPDAEGDPLPVGARLAAVSERDLAAILGEDFAARVFRLPRGRWSDPVRSPQGLHLIRILGGSPAAALPLASVRGQATEALLEERRETRLRRRLDRLRALYGVPPAQSARIPPDPSHERGRL